MNVPRVQCDLCSYIWTPRSWEDSDKGGEMTFRRDGINGGMKWEHLCKDCRSHFVTAFQDASKARFQIRLGEAGPNIPVDKS